MLTFTLELANGEFHSIAIEEWDSPINFAIDKGWGMPVQVIPTGTLAV